MDGSGGARTAWVYKEWNKNSTGVDPGNFGYPANDPEVYRQMVRLLHQAGVTCRHACHRRSGDRLGGRYLRGGVREKPTRGCGTAIIHANIPTDHAIDSHGNRSQRRYDAGYPEIAAAFHMVDRR